jgi:predicted Zn-dependent peptidase
LNAPSSRTASAWSPSDAARPQRLRRHLDRHRLARGELDETGISHFIEHMVFKGTKNRSAEQIARSVDSIGGGLDAFTSKELVSYNVKVLDEHLPEAFDVVTDLVRNPLFEKNDIEKEKGVILEELKMEVDNPEYLIHEIFSSNFWKGTRWAPDSRHQADHPRLRSRQGGAYYQTVLYAVEYPDHRRRQPEHKHWCKLAEDRFADLKPRRTRQRPTPQPHAPLVFRNKNSLEQVHVYLGVPSIPMPHESRFACYILNAILGGGMSSRLFQNIREKQGLAYTVYSELTMYRDAGCMLVYAGRRSSRPER